MLEMVRGPVRRLSKSRIAPSNAIIINAVSDKYQHSSSMSSIPVQPEGLVIPDGESTVGVLVCLFVSVCFSK